MRQNQWEERELTHELARFNTLILDPKAKGFYSLRIKLLFSFSPLDVPRGQKGLKVNWKQVRSG